MAPFFAKYPHLTYSYLVEVKYVTRAEFTANKLTAALQASKTQLQQYATDPRIIKRSQGSQLIKVALVFAGWELKALEIV